MNTLKSVKTTHKDSADPHPFLWILLIALVSLAMGLIPIVYGLGTPETPNTIPTEAGF